MTSKVKRITKFNRCIQFVISGHPTVATRMGDRREYDVAVTALNNYFVPKVNNAFARQVFHGINPAAGETIQQFATRLKKAALDCAYGAETDNNILDAILWKCPSTYIKRRLLEEGDELTIVRTLTLAAQCKKNRN